MENSSKNKHAAGDSPANKRLSVERIYQKKSQLEHILLRPDTYIGSVETQTSVSCFSCFNTVLISISIKRL